MTFRKDRWLGNQWASIDIEPVDPYYFLPVLYYFMATYGIARPTVIDTLDGYTTEFTIQGCSTILSIDAWTFSIAFEQDAMRDRVYDALVQLPLDYFDS